MTIAILKNYRQSPRKVRLVADSVRGKKVNQALIILDFMPKRASKTVAKVLRSAIANAKHNHNLDEKDLFVKEVMVDDGFTLKRWRMRARGSVAPIRKRTSHIKVVLGEKKSGKTVVTEESKMEESGVKKAPKKTVKKPATKKVAKKPATKKETKVKSNKK